MIKEEIMSKKIDVLNLKGEKVKDIKLEDNIFNIKPNDAVIKDAVVAAMAGARQGTAKVKTRSEVSGGGRKPYRQKGTGNARQGSIRAPHYRHGGIVFGPVPRDYSKKMNKKEKRLALKSALSYKVLDSEVLVLDNLVVNSSKTKDMLNIMKDLKLEDVEDGNEVGDYIFDSIAYNAENNEDKYEDKHRQSYSFKHRKACDGAGCLLSFLARPSAAVCSTVAASAREDRDTGR